MARISFVVGKDGASLPADALAQVDSVLAGRGIAAPFALIVARTGDGQPIVVAGTDFERVQQLDRWWSVSHWPAGFAAGSDWRARTAVGLPEESGVRSQLPGTTLHVNPAGTVQTGRAEDSRIYISLADFVAWTGVQPSTIEVAASGSPEEVAGIMNQLAQAIPAAMFVRCGRSWKARPACSARRAPRCWLRRR